MKRSINRIILLLICLMPLIASAQEAKPAAEKSPIASRAQRQKAKQKWKEDRIVERDNKKAIKDHHKKLQTKATLKAMKREKRKSEKLRANKKGNFFTRLFRR